MQIKIQSNVVFKHLVNNDKKIIIESENLTMNFLNIYDVISAIKIVKNKNNLR